MQRCQAHREDPFPLPSPASPPSSSSPSQMFLEHTATWLGEALRGGASSTGAYFAD